MPARTTNEDPSEIEINDHLVGRSLPMDQEKPKRQRKQKEPEPEPEPEQYEEEVCRTSTSNIEMKKDSEGLTFTAFFED